MKATGIKVFEVSANAFGDTRDEKANAWLKENVGKIEILKTKEMLTARENDQHWKLIIIIYYRELPTQQRIKPDEVSRSENRI